MTATHEAKSSEPMPLDHILESAVVISWSNLVRGAIPGLVQVEYHVGKERLIDDLRIWSSTSRGYWSLVCHCSIDPDLSCTLHFRNGYLDGGFGNLLAAIMKRQGEFPHKQVANANYLVQVGPPSVDVLALAKTSIDTIAGS
jgi:hypothetical protein